MENEINRIKLDSINETSLEGIRDFFKTQLDEIVLPYIYKNKLMLIDKDNPIYKEYIGINVDLDSLILINNSELSSQEKKEKINNLLNELYNRMKKLVIEVSKNEKKSNDGNQLHKFK